MPIEKELQFLTGRPTSTSVDESFDMANPYTEPSEGNRFSALLNPIRDLASNWGIDVAKELSEYAESLGIHIHAESEPSSPALTLRETPVDFAQAALLVQGSTSIYSRKVEHLYGLVFAAVEQLNQARGRAPAAGNGTSEPVETDADADALMNIDDVQFLDLDNVPVAKPDSITVQDGELPPAGSLSDKTCLRPIPLMLIQGNGSKADNLGRASYKMLSSHTDPSGAMIMDGCPLFDEDLNLLPQRPQTEHLPNPAEAPMSNDDDGYEDHDDGFDDAGDVGYSTPPPMEKSAMSDDGTILVAVAGSARKRRDPQVVAGQPPKRQKPRQDPFLMLDAHAEIASLDRPLKLGRPFRIPKEPLSQPSAAGEKFPCYDEDLPDGDLERLILGAIPRGKSIRTYLFNEQVLRRQYREVLRKRTAAKRRRALRSNRLLDLAMVEENEDLVEDCGRNETHVRFADNGDDFGFDADDNDDYDDVLQFPSLDDAPTHDNNSISGMADAMNATGGRLSDELVELAISYEEACKEHLRKTAWMWEQRTVDTQLVQRVEKWAARIKPLLEEEDQRGEFDITAYGQSLIRAFPKKDVSMPMTKMRLLFSADSEYEVCRMFLATLQLANNYSVEIVPGQTESFSDPSVRLVVGPDAAVTRTPLSKIGSKRIRVVGSTPVSSRRPPLRPRLESTLPIMNL